MGLMYPAKNSGWMQLVTKVNELWDHHRASRLGQLVVEEIGRLCPYPLTGEEKYSMQFMIRAMVAETDVVHVLAPVIDSLPEKLRQTLPEDFVFACCEKHMALEALLKEVCEKAL